MAHAIIMLRRDPTTGKQNIFVKLESDSDALPIEHEQLHKAVVEKLIGKGLDPNELGQVIIERVPPTESVGTTSEDITDKGKIPTSSSR